MANVFSTRIGAAAVRIAVFTAVMALAAAVGSATASPRRPAVAAHGMVVSAHPAASEAGLAMLKAGGNAVDAAVAAAFTAGVVEPYSSGIGGGGFMLVHDARSGRFLVIDYRETAPAAADRDMFLDAGKNVVAGASLSGHRASGVPGTVAGLLLAHEKFGRLPRKTVLQPAIRWAETGFPADEEFIEKSIEARADLATRAEAARIFLGPGGRPKELGEPVVQKDLARTLGQIARRGKDAFYTGPVAAAIALDMKTHGGLITARDLASYAPRMREPLRAPYRDVEIVTMPPPSSGGVHLIEMLNVLGGYDLKAMGHGSAASMHLMAETMRRAFADRAKFLGDPAFVKIPVTGLVSKSYASSLRAAIDPGVASPSSAVGPGDPWPHESNETTHLCAVDREGNAVSLTQTINGLFGSGIVAPGTGVLLNNEMDDFSIKPGVANMYGLVGGEANAIAAGKIPLSSMTPTMVLRGGRPFLVVGSPGGARIITTVLQVIVNVVDFDMDVRQAVDMPRMHHQWLPDEIWLEPFAAPAEVERALETRGHTLARHGTFGNAMAIMVEPKTGRILGTADSRGIGAADGY